MYFLVFINLSDSGPNVCKALASQLGQMRFVVKTGNNIYQLRRAWNTVDGEWPCPPAKFAYVPLR